MNIRMHTAAREATTKARNVASAIQQVTVRLMMITKTSWTR